jgi:hypothetical protein
LLEAPPPGGSSLHEVGEGYRCRRDDPGAAQRGAVQPLPPRARFKV